MTKQELYDTIKMICDSHNYGLVPKKTATMRDYIVFLREFNKRVNEGESPEIALMLTSSDSGYMMKKRGT